MILNITQAITLDLAKQTAPVCICAKQGDEKSRMIRITLVRDGEPFAPPSGASAAFRAQKPDGTMVLNSAVVAPDGTVTVELTRQTLAVAGSVTADVYLTDSAGAVLSSASFVIHVEPAPNGVQADSENEFLHLSALVGRAEQAAIRAEGAVQDALHPQRRDNPHGVTAEQVGAATNAALNAHAGNRSNPHGVTAAQIGAAPAGYGYGGEIPNLITASSDQELNTKLDGLLAGMPNFSARNVRITHNGNQIVNGVFGMGGQGTLYGTLYKHSNDYAILSVYSYLGSQFSMTKNSRWGEVEWVNPVVKMGGEYRTTEKYNGKPIYTSMIGGGKCPASTTRTVRHNFKIDQIIKQSGWINYFGVVLPYFDPDRPADKLVAETTANKTVVSIKTNTDAWTAYNWFVQIWYTKE